MARNSMLPMAGGGGLGRKVVGTLVCVVVLALVIRDPVGAAHMVERLASWGSEFLDALHTFGSELAPEKAP